MAIQSMVRSAKGMVLWPALFMCLVLFSSTQIACCRPTPPVEGENPVEGETQEGEQEGEYLPCDQGDCGYQILQTYPHDPEAFTQGLFYYDGFLYEGTGMYNQSSLRKVVLETGEVVQQQDLDGAYFGEGITLWENSIIQLTWKSQTAFVYDRDSFILMDQFSYATQGWGLCQDGEKLIMSDGSDTLYFLDPQSYATIGQIEVRDAGDPVEKLNELEYVNGEILANVWYEDRIARINPETGEVQGWIDLSGLLPAEKQPEPNVLNGIAYDAAQDRLFVTGKYWPYLFEIRLIAPDQ